MENEKQKDSPQDGKQKQNELGTKPIGIPGGQTGGQTNSPTGVVMPQHPDDPQADKKK